MSPFLSVEQDNSSGPVNILPDEQKKFRIGQ